MKYFFDNGLDFQCQQCGHCCTIPDGYVYMHPSEIREISARLGMSEKKFREKYMTTGHSKNVLKSFPNGECIFFDRGTGCRIYEFRPRQCVTFPFWPYNLRAKQNWEDLKNECPGVGKGRHFSKDEIIRNIHEKLRRD